MDANPSSAIERCLRERFPEACIEVDSADGVHFRIDIRDPSFSGMTPLARHRLVHSVLAPLLASGRVHAVEIHPQAPGGTS